MTSVPGRWLVVEVRPPSEALAPALAEGLVAAGGSAVEEVDGALRTWLPDPTGGAVAAPAAEAALDTTPRSLHEAPAAVRTVLGAVQEALAAAETAMQATAARDRGSKEPVAREPAVQDPAALEPVARSPAEDVGARLRWWWQPDEDWGRLWRRGLGARRAGRVVVAPTWTEVSVEPGEVLVRIDPKMAFGTGEHPTTRGALRLLQQAEPRGGRILDVGAGSAVLAIAAVLLGAGQARAVESDGDAIDNARENVALNSVGHGVSVEHALVDPPWLERERGTGFDIILANVLSSVLVPLLVAFRAALVPGGRLILGGILTAEAATVRKAADRAGLVLAAEDVEGEWWGGLLVRPAG